ncbi:MAG: Asp-tRNA(Asn)/Glu-tRNA(Gln) amidotransferase subunit GatC [Candidatus Dadabacteria bacterium]|nr:Asp-tRNA(Asn)/Glu-tRNA(Gln) amidotransferase subunit GatC [Candidatus Dadabacteria bacterium]NIS09209.1 Asp-tRNA(Asn)/Glu-tRNA(Gln) amidotransferase subunit GatC [Candidatus Dadabacteria bacterium]NIV43193.1 Asp-tRNA(Asn)/Glu-tRNA(Gln) amidotransferase subunit GatC [Candidatus Dadabacteria bacterium]NIY22259.1 Asp-tRNA(Asn)/Glu-tRNA(Gln) amidotransferase subunit GatC [Candidatus Dadabacteria bacterium]
MKITTENVKEVAELTRLEFAEDEIEDFRSQFENILKFISKLDELDIDDVKPTTHVLDISTPMREDVVADWIVQDEAMKNAPQPEDGFFGVPKVIED